MSEFQAFFADNAVAVETEDFVVSDRFTQKVKKTDKDGKPYDASVPIPWKLKGIPEEQNDAIRTSATRKVKGKNGIMIPETNSSEYLAKLAAACVVYPNLNDKELQKSYGTLGADNLIRKMLLSGEYASLVGKIQQINGFDKDINELADEVKN